MLTGTVTSSSGHSRGVVGEVEEETDVLHGAVLLEVLLEEAGGLHVHLSDRHSSVQVSHAQYSHSHAQVSQAQYSSLTLRLH